MDKSQLRDLILKLQDRLSDNDRKRLHFYFDNIVPRRISDDTTYEGTLRLMQVLFDQNVINDQNCTCLIEAYKKINFVEGYNALIEYRRQIKFKQSNPNRTLVRLHEEIFEDQDIEEDKSATQLLVAQVNNISQSNQIIDSQHTSINPVTINFENKPIYSPKLSKTQLSSLVSRINKFFLYSIFLLIAIVIILSGLLIMNIGKYMILNKEVLRNLTEIHQKYPDPLNRLDQFDQLNESLNRSMIRPGKRFGFDEYESGYFDDSLLRHFTSLYYLNEIIILSDNYGIEAYKFKYVSSPSSSLNTITSFIHGNEDRNLKSETRFYNEKIVKVKGLIKDKIITNNDGTSRKTSTITNLVFISENGIRNPMYGDANSYNFEEYFKGFYLGYVTGKKNEDYINQIQFFWYRQ